MHTQFSLENLRIYGRTILKWIVREECVDKINLPHDRVQGRLLLNSAAPSGFITAFLKRIRINELTNLFRC